jgi:hypothetical protein
MSGIGGPRVTLFTTGPECSLCERTRADLDRLARVLAFRLEVVDLRDRPERILDYALRAPVVHVDGRLAAEGRIEPSTLESALRNAGAAPAAGGGGRG